MRRSREKSTQRVLKSANMEARGIAKICTCFDVPSHQLIVLPHSKRDRLTGNVGSRTHLKTHFFIMLGISPWSRGLMEVAETNRTLPSCKWLKFAYFEFYIFLYREVCGLAHYKVIRESTSYSKIKIKSNFCRVVPAYCLDHRLF